jgi:iron complex outermembrane receptor protein
MTTRVLSALAFLILLLEADGSAQTTSLRGRVTDPDRGAVIGAQVALTPVPSGTRVTARTQNDGSFELSGMAPGRYQLEVLAPGFASWTQDVTLDAGPRTIDATLQIATLSEDVTVRANAIVSSIGKTAAPLRDQPITVNRITSDFLQTQGVNDLVVALQSVANVNSWNQYGVYEYYSFRGFSDSVQLVDGIRNEGNRVRSQLSNVESIEILKGPASVLYGSEAIGGTVNIVLKKPSSQPAYDFSASAGSWKTFRTSFGATGRLVSDALLYRFDFGAESSDNFRHDPWTRYNAAPALSWRIGSHDLFDVRYMLNRNSLSGDGGIPQVTQPDGTVFIPDVPRDRRYNTPDDFALSTDQNIRSSYTHSFPNGFGIRNVFAGRLFDDEYWVAESLRTTYPSTVNRTFLYFKHKRRPWQNQTEFTGLFDAGVSHDVLVGWDYQDYSTRTTRADAASVATTPIDLYNPVETSTLHPTFDPTRYDYTDAITNAVYGQDQLTLTSQLKAVVGGRFDYIDRDTHNNPVVNGIETPVAPTHRIQKRSTGRGGLVYQPISQLDVYGQYATSFRPNFNVQPDGSTLEPEYGAQLEIGQRSRLLQDRVQVNAALFRIVKRNVTFSRPGGFFEQVGKVRAQGFEIDTDMRLSSAWRLSLGYGYTDATYLDYRTSLTTDLSGNKRPRVPPHSFNAMGFYSVSRRLTLTANVQVKDSQFLNDQNTLTLEGFTLLNLGALYNLTHLQFALNVSNVSDHFYYASTLGNTQFYPGEPRRVMFTVRVR